MVPRILSWLQNFWNIYIAQLFTVVKLFLVTHLSASKETIVPAAWDCRGGLCFFFFRFFFYGGTDITHNEGENNHCHKAHRHTYNNKRNRFVYQAVTSSNKNKRELLWYRYRNIPVYLPLEPYRIVPFKADSHTACRAHAVPLPCRWGFRMRLSHLIYTVRPGLIHICHAMLRPCRSLQGHSTAVERRPCCGLEKNAMVGAWLGHGMTSMNQKRPHCVNKMGKTHSKPLAARHGRGTAWVRHEKGMLCVNRPL